MKEPVSNNVQTVNIQPIAVPAISVDELKEMTGYFSTGAVIGEGSSGRVYYAVLKSGQAAAIKKLDSSKQSDQEFLAQVRHMHRSDCVQLCYIVCGFLNKILSLGTCLCRSLWSQD